MNTARTLLSVFLLVGAAVVSDPARASQPAAWTDLPLIEPARGWGSRMAKGVMARNLEAAELLAIASFDGSTPPEGACAVLPLDKGSAKVTAHGEGGYYWVSAREDGAETVKSASGIVYFSNPGPAPRTMLETVKGDLEIVPDPLPREHGRYREGETWSFLVRFMGRPLAGKDVTLQTARGTFWRLTTDADGRVSVTFPGDITASSAGGGDHSMHGGGAQAAQPGQAAPRRHRHGPPSTPFVLAVEHHDGERTYLSAFNYTYSTSPYAGRSLLSGAGFMVIGMLLATPLLRRRKTAEKGGAR